MIKSLIIAAGLLTSIAFGKVPVKECNDVFVKNHIELTTSQYLLMGQQPLPNNSGVLFIYGNNMGVFIIGFIDPAIFPSEGVQKILESPTIISSGKCMMKGKSMIWALEYNQVKSAEEEFKKPKEGTKM